jgi:hypothetical protein
MRKVAVAVVLIAWGFLSVQGMAADEDWELSAEAGYHWPQQDVKDFSPDLLYGAALHYWMNDTSTLDIFVNQFSTYREVPVYEDGQEAGEEKFFYDTLLVMGGVRYFPEWDIFFAPYLGLGLGIQSWTFRCDLLDKRGGAGIAYYAVAGGMYRLTSRVRVELWSRYVYVPFNERVDKEIYLLPPGDVDREREDLESAGFLMFGMNLSFKIN